MSNDEKEAAEAIQAAQEAIRRALLAAARAELSQMNVIDPLAEAHRLLAFAGRVIAGSV